MFQPRFRRGLIRPMASAVGLIRLWRKKGNADLSRSVRLRRSETSGFTFIFKPIPMTIGKNMSYRHKNYNIISNLWQVK